MSDEEAECGHIPILRRREQWSDPKHVGDVVFGSSFQQHITYLHVVLSYSFVQSSVAMNTVKVHCSAVVQQHGNYSSIVPLTGCRKTS